MKKALKVLTRMRLSCCWGDNLNVKELNDVVDYINELEQQVKKQNEIINKLNDLLSDEFIEVIDRDTLLDILKGCENK